MSVRLSGNPALLRAIGLDKKRRGSVVRWVLLMGIGQPLVRDDVPPGVAAEVIGEVTAK